MLTNIKDRLTGAIWLTFCIVALYLACAAQFAHAQEFNDESFEARLNRTTQEVLGRLDQRVTSLEERVAALENKTAAPAVPVVVTAPAVPQKPATVAKSVQVLRTQSELNAWVRQHYNRSTPISTGVSPTSAVWRHLQDGNHGFRASQVNGLEFWVAYALHDAHHRGLITPWKTATTTQPVVAERSERVEVKAKAAPQEYVQRSVTVQRTYSMGCANGGCAKQYAPLTGRVGPVRRLFRGW